MIAIERIWPANQLPTTRRWWLRIILLNLAQAGVVVLAGGTWDRWFSGKYLFDSSELPAVAQVVIGYVATTFIYYWWHRLRHESAFFWKVCHQIHHSPRRMEVAMSFYKHPVEITVNGLLSSAISFLLLGLSTEAAVAVSITTGIAEFFYHWNIRTPRWLGFLIQRPESHRVHHEKNRHTDNYADVPLWDMLFGTFRNPVKRVEECGFDDVREQRFTEMLQFKDVHQRLNPTCLGCSKRWICQASKES